jgi:DUF2075 family protein
MIKTNVENIGKWSNIEIEVQCDSCYIEKKLKYKLYTSYGYSDGEYLCKKCKLKKNNLEKFGVENVFQLESVKEKSRKRNLEKFGVEFVSQSNDIKAKIKKSISKLDKNEINQKRNETNLKKYGVNNVSQIEIIKEKKKETTFKNIGENQVKEIIQSCKLAIFLIDEDQKVTFSDIGSKEEIVKWANFENATVHHMALESQFRCNGSDGYLAWLDDVLGIRETANKTLDALEYDFQVLSNPNDLKELIFNKNKINNKARIVAGYCWNWISRSDKSVFDITIPNFDFGMQWNLDTDGSLWIQAPDSVSEVGCIHTCQGLEVDYVGVIIGDDLIVRNGEVITNPNARAKTDKSISGFKKLFKMNPEVANKKADGIIRNTYRTLMTRGMKGCYVFCTDPETQAYFQDRLRVKN